MGKDGERGRKETQKRRKESGSYRGVGGRRGKEER